MKYKASEVTNSSSSSFVVWGLYMGLDDIKEKYGHTIWEKECVILGPAIANKSEEDFMDEFDSERLSELCDKHGLDHSRMAYDDYETMIGISPFTMKEDQTLREFKEEISKKFSDMGINLSADELQQIEEAWMDN